ncbi:MAG: rimK [Candidatus Saccharibacteria bacterium]|nr:rimK [Candidatus Saccharibacteria bacterium]
MQNNNSIIIVSGTANGPGALELQVAARRLGFTASIVAPDDENIVTQIAEATHAIYRVGPKSYSLYASLLEKLGGSDREVLAHVLRAFDKRDTFTMLSEASISIPRSWLIKTGDPFSGDTFVVKIPKGNQGRGVELIHNQAELDAFYKTYADEQEYLAQEFIAEAHAQDKRLFVVGDTVVAAMKRTSTTDDFRANLHLGAEGNVYAPTPEEIDMARQSIAAFGLSYGGVDIIDSSRGPLVLEVNPSPGFGISQVTGVDVANEVIKNLLGVGND